MMQATLCVPPTREEVLGDFRAWIIAHLCDFGHEHPPRYPAAPDVYRANGARDIVLGVMVLRWESYDSDDLDTVYEAYWRMRYDGTFIRRDEPPACYDSGSFGVFRRWSTGGIFTDLHVDTNRIHANRESCRGRPS